MFAQGLTALPVPLCDQATFPTRLLTLASGNMASYSRHVRHVLGHDILYVICVLSSGIIHWRGVPFVGPYLARPVLVQYVYAYNHT